MFFKCILCRPGWHGKIPNSGFHVVRSKSGASGMVKVELDEMSRVGFRIHFSGNVELEANLRNQLGMEDGEDFNSNAVKDMLQSRLMEEEEAKRMAEEAAKLSSDDEEMDPHRAQQEKKEKTQQEREAGQKKKDKAVSREQKAKARQKMMESQ